MAGTAEAADRSAAGRRVWAIFCGSFFRAGPFDEKH